MKRLSLLFIINGLIILLIFGITGVFQSCTKEGPMGEQGPAGEDGMNATAVCGTCHNLGTLDTVETRYKASGHANEGFALGYAGSRNDCAKCHSNEGFHETILTGMDTTAEGIAIPTKISCETCHDEHQTLDFETDGKDYALAHNDPISLMITGHQETADLEGSSNLCAYCHQPRNPGDNIAIGGDSLSTYEHWGPHYGGQATILSGKGAFKFAGSMEYENSPHTTGTSCADCHMAETGNMIAGGHTMNMQNEDGSDNVAGCTSCHSDASDFDIEGVQTKIAGLMDDLQSELLSRDLITVEEDGVHVHPKKVSGTEAAAMVNYMLVYYDGSHGIHNPDFTEALLTNTIEQLQGKS